MNTKRTSIKDNKSPLDDLFTKTDINEVSLLRDAPIKPSDKEKEDIVRRSLPDDSFLYKKRQAKADGFALLNEEIKKKKHKQLRLEDEKKAELQNLRSTRAKKTGTKRQTSLVMHDYQLDWLEMKRVETQIHGGTPLGKAKLIRAAIDVLMELQLNLAGVKSEEEIRKRIKSYFPDRNNSLEYNTLKY